MKYSQQRVDNVVNSLKAKGIPASQIEAKAYGDTVQPYAENDKNRCVIIEGK
jgi:outer membrane protein OmpA-like peptidoglycan-associated protein